MDHLLSMEKDKTKTYLVTEKNVLLSFERSKDFSRRIVL